jgi:hypothetical protein
MLAKVIDTVAAVADMVTMPQTLAPLVARTLPPDTAAFTGRVPELEQLQAAAAGYNGGPGAIGIAAISGMAGVGKTAFAVHAVHLLAPLFPDGQLFVSLNAHTPGQHPTDPEVALASLLLATGSAAQAIPAGLADRQAMWRDRMDGRRVLLMLDDATGSSQVRPLLFASSGALALVTSRHRLSDLPEALPLELKMLEPVEAAWLFTRLAARPDIRAEDGIVARIVLLCGCLPLAVSLAAGHFKHHPVWTLSDLADHLESAADAVIAGSGLVAASFSLSYGNLPADQQQFFRRLGLYPGADI